MTAEITTVGIDVGATALHVVGLDDDGSITLADTLSPDELNPILAKLEHETWVAIDAPDEQREPRHLTDETISPKFRAARCAEVALGRRGYWVPWVTPGIGTEAPGWMLTGFRVWGEARSRGLRTIEVYPHAAFRALAGPGKLAKKTTVIGTRQRVALLKAADVRAEGLAMWSHDSLDAVVGAVVARDAAAGTAENVRCQHPDEEPDDGSSIWLPFAAGR
jgi:predicted nuclease with RNAse H fold